ncbi:hypothetical protein QM012_005357 [Aureobasidium pullulans]|uniref:Uncharacterized protein n=1 Tax=Aureobasidium pullulans TaxID=5580 RepID=A0ABR0T583_AURPU
MSDPRKTWSLGLFTFISLSSPSQVMQERKEIMIGLEMWLLAFSADTNAAKWQMGHAWYIGNLFSAKVDYLIFHGRYWKSPTSLKNAQRFTSRIFVKRTQMAMWPMLMIFSLMLILHLSTESDDSWQVAIHRAIAVKTLY